MSLVWPLVIGTVAKLVNYTGVYPYYSVSVCVCVCIYIHYSGVVVVVLVVTHTWSGLDSVLQCQWGHTLPHVSTLESHDWTRRTTTKKINIIIINVVHHYYDKRLLQYVKRLPSGTPDNTKYDCSLYTLVFLPHTVSIWLPTVYLWVNLPTMQVVVPDCLLEGEIAQHLLDCFILPALANHFLCSFSSQYPKNTCFTTPPS